MSHWKYTPLACRGEDIISSICWRVLCGRILSSPSWRLPILGGGIMSYGGETRS